MKILGIIAEYNPFHKGHMYHIQKAKELSEADAVAVVMSGHAVQRGDVAICDKWKRAEMAVKGGADLVVELPVIYSAQSAEFFAQGGVGILEAIGCDFISFGVENDDAEKLQEVADILKNPEFETAVNEELKKGTSYPSARSTVLKQMGFGTVADTPNNILAIEYLKANKTMTPIPVKRLDYDHDGYGSASFIRRLISEGKDYSDFVPDFTVDILQRAFAEGTAPVQVANLDTAITAILRTIDTKTMANIRDVSEGLENRIKASAGKFATVQEIADDVKTKRYTHSRIRRVLVNTALGITKDTATMKPSYIRVLGMNEKGMKILKDIKDTCPLPVITKVALSTDEQLSYDIKATDIYSLAFPNPEYRKSSLDMTTSPIIIKAQE